MVYFRVSFTKLHIKNNAKDINSSEINFIFQTLESINDSFYLFLLSYCFHENNSILLQ